MEAEVSQNVNACGLQITQGPQSHVQTHQWEKEVEQIPHEYRTLQDSFRKGQEIKENQVSKTNHFQVSHLILFWQPPISAELSMSDIAPSPLQRMSETFDKITKPTWSEHVVLPFCDDSSGNGRPNSEEAHHDVESSTVSSNSDSDESASNAEGTKSSLFVPPPIHR